MLQPRDETLATVFQRTVTSRAREFTCPEPSPPRARRLPSPRLHISRTGMSASVNARGAPAALGSCLNSLLIRACCGGSAARLRDQCTPISL